MLKNLALPFLILVAGATSLQAQLVETTRPTATKKQPASSASKNPASKILDKKLSDFGITPRSLATWKTTGGKPTLVFYDVSFKKIEKPAPGSWERPVDPKAFLVDGLTLIGFQVQGADFLANGKDYRNLALLRLAKKVPQVSKDGGKTWVDGEKVGESWVFAFDNETLALNNADETFTPVEFRAWAFERGAVTRSDGRPEEKYLPYFHSSVITVAYGRNEMQGLMKFPGSPFVVAFRGIQFKDRWIARSLETQPFNTALFNNTSGSQKFIGAKALNTGERLFPQFEITSDHIQVGTGSSFINYSQAGDSAEQLRSAMEFELNRGVALPEIADAYKANIKRAFWTRSDEDGSFSREAEKAYVGTGKVVWFYPPFWTNNSVLANKDADNYLRPLVERIKGLGGKVDLIPQR